MEVSTNLHESQFISMEAFVEVGGSRFTCMEITVEVGRSQFTCMEVSGSFNVSTCKFLCRWKWKLPLLPSMAASTNIFRGSFHELPYTPTYFHLLPRVSYTSSCFHKTILNPNPDLIWSYLHGSCPTSNFHGSR